MSASLHPLDELFDVTHNVDPQRGNNHRCAIPAPFGFAIRNGEVCFYGIEDQDWGTKSPPV
jgi:hypothetical protein